MILEDYQSIIDHINSILNKEIGIVDIQGSIIACSDLQKIGQSIPQVLNFLKSSKTSLNKDNFLFQKVFLKSRPEFIAYIKSDVIEDMKYLSLLAFNISMLRKYYDDRQDKETFLKKVISGNAESLEIGLRAKSFHIPIKVPRVVLLIKTTNISENYVYEIMQGLFPNKTKDLLIEMNDHEIVLVKELGENADFNQINKTATVISDMLQTEVMIRAKIGIGTVVGSLEDLNVSYSQAKASLQIGSIFNKESLIFNYNSLGIGKLIYKLSREDCKHFLDEISNYDFLESLDSETLKTIQVFFENNLNVSEAARKLYTHRNTLVYRLEKIRKLTNFDITKFEDAVTLKIVLLVKNYMDSLGERKIY